ncbi:collagen alpha-1(XII) chain-like [Periplaneta americana]|uniref:collagen alpha-1(XII) chain-like n=1 Tax=Periplaneta americana TaxID=6978 RepID=UPI0037E97E9E
MEYRNVWLRIAVVTAAMLIVHTGVPATPSIKCPTITGNETVPHPVNCSQYYMCVYGKPELMLCPAGLHFSVKLNDCDDPDDANCDKHCDALVDDVGGTWTPSPCTTEASNVGTTCNLNCNTNFTLSGSASVQCTENGWNSSNGNALPKCITLQCLSNQIVGQMNKTLSKEAGLLFVLDESGSIGSDDFQKSKAFVNDIISRFPLSATRSAGVITFDSNPIVRIPLRETSTSNFQATVSNLPYRGGGTKVREAMEEAIAEIARHRVHPLTLVILITDGQTETDATEPCNRIKAAKNPIFTIAVKDSKLHYVESLASLGDNGIKHFFHMRDFGILKSIGQYINPHSGVNTSGGSSCP